MERFCFSDHTRPFFERYDRETLLKVLTAFDGGAGLVLPHAVPGRVRSLSRHLNVKKPLDMRYKTQESPWMFRSLSNDRTSGIYSQRLTP